MFTLEESALLGRLLRFLTWMAVAILVSVAVWLARRWFGAP